MGSVTQVCRNGTFDVDSQWTKGTGWSITGGKAVASSASGGQAIFQTSLPLVPGVLYSITFTVSNRTSGAIRPQLEGTVGSNVSTNGTFTQILEAPSQTARLFFNSVSASTSLELDNVIVTKFSPFNDIIKPADVPTTIFNNPIRTFAGEEPCLV